MKNRFMKTAAIALAAVCGLLATSCSAGGQSKMFGEMIYTEPEKLSYNESMGLKAGIAAEDDENTLRMNTCNQLLTGLDSGKFKVFECPEIMCKYYIAQNDKTVYISDNDYEKATLHTKMMTALDNEKLCGVLSEAIESLEKDGTLAELTEKWITGIDNGEIPHVEPNEPKDGQPVYNVGVTGDFAPLDYVSESGKPDGFNVALMNAIGEKINAAFNYVSVEWTARTSALASKKVEIIFASEFGEAGAERFEDYDLCVSREYYTGAYSALLLKDNLDEVKQYYTERYGNDYPDGEYKITVCGE